LHVGFKIAAVVLYYLGSFLIGSSNAFILIVLCGAFDFWVVKNITGRYF
jgi:hypothetical protein